MFCPKCFLSARRHTDFIERTLFKVAEAMDYAARAEDAGRSPGLLQRIDPRAKLVGLLLLIVAAVASHRAGVTTCVFAVGMLLAYASGMTVLRMTAKLWSGVFVFTGAVVLPAIFITPGNTLWRLPFLDWPVTTPGVQCAVNLIARAETTATLATLMVLTTPWTHVLKSLRALRVPVIGVVILEMTHRYLFLLLHIALDFFEARRARTIGTLAPAQRRHMAVSSAGALLSKSIQLSADAYEAMQARGFQGTVFTLDEFHMKCSDWSALAMFGIIAGAALWLGRV